MIRGRQTEDKARHFLHRGIAARQFQRAFLLADGMEVLGADLSNGLLSIDLARPEPDASSGRSTSRRTRPDERRLPRRER